MATGAYNPYGQSYAQRQKLAQTTYPNQTVAAPKLQSAPNTYGTNYSAQYFPNKTYDTAYNSRNYGWGNAAQANSWNYGTFSNAQKDYLSKLNNFNTEISNDYANWMNQVNSSQNYGNILNEMSYYMNPQREYQQQLAYQNLLNSLNQNQTNAAARGLGYTGLAAGLDQRANQAYATNLLQAEDNILKQALGMTTDTISNQNTTGAEWLHNMAKAYDGGLGQLNTLASLFGTGAGQASDYEKVQNQLANALRIAELQAAVDREKMANDLRIANINSGSRGGGGGGYSGGGYSGGGSGNAQNAGTMYVWNNATKTIDAVPATIAAWNKNFNTSVNANKNVRMPASYYEK